MGCWKIKWPVAIGLSLIRCFVGRREYAHVTQVISWNVLIFGLIDYFDFYPPLYPLSSTMFNFYVYFYFYLMYSFPFCCSNSFKCKQRSFRVHLFYGLFEINFWGTSYECHGTFRDILIDKHLRFTELLCDHCSHHFRFLRDHLQKLKFNWSGIPRNIFQNWMLGNSNEFVRREFWQF